MQHSKGALEETQYSSKSIRPAGIINKLLTNELATWVIRRGTGKNSNANDSKAGHGP